MPMLILIPIIVGLAAQAIKLSIDGIPKNLNWQHLLRDYGGMPSSHAAFVASLTTAILLYEGWHSAAFAVSFALMIIVIRDAVGFRREIGRNAVLTNLIAKSTLKNKKINYLPERIGHTPEEVLAGFGVGLALTVIIYFALMIY